jgi:putative GTP pyrophosphokinase
MEQEVPMAIEITSSFLNAHDDLLGNLDPQQQKVLGDFIGLRQIYGSAIREVTTKLEVLNDEFSMIHDRNPIHHIESRLKTPQSMISKLARKNLDITVDSLKRHLTDIAGVRVICYYIDDIYMIAKLLSGQDDVKVLRRSDYIQSPKENGYRSLHLVITAPVYLSNRKENVPVEIQIRTVAMDFWASLEHQIRYKKDQAISPGVLDELRNCASDIAAIDKKMQDLQTAVWKLKDSGD